MFEELKALYFEYLMAHKDIFDGYSDIFLHATAGIYGKRLSCESADYSNLYFILLSGNIHPGFNPRTCNDSDGISLIDPLLSIEDNDARTAMFEYAFFGPSVAIYRSSIDFYRPEYFSNTDDAFDYNGTVYSDEIRTRTLITTDKIEYLVFPFSMLFDVYMLFLEKYPNCKNILYELRLYFCYNYEIMELINNEFPHIKCYDLSMGCYVDKEKVAIQKKKMYELKK